MEQIHAYLELHKRLRGTLLFAGFFVASVALYIVTALWLVGIPGASPSFFWDSVLPFSCVLLALICDFAITWVIYQPSRRRFWSTLTLVSSAIVLGATFVSVAIWRGNWLELVKEIFHSIGTTR